MNIPVSISTPNVSHRPQTHHPHQDRRRRRTQAGLLDRVATDRGAKKARLMATTKAEHDALFSRAGFGQASPGTQRLFLALQSTLSEEVDWALTGLLYLSKERGLLFSAYPGSAEAIVSIVEEWVRSTIERHPGGLPAFHLDDHVDREMESRATTATLILLNSLAEHEENRRILSLIRCRPTAEAMADGTHQSTTPVRILSILDNVFGDLRADAVLELSARSPELVSYLLEVLRMLLPYLMPNNNAGANGKTESDDPLTVETVQAISSKRLGSLFSACQDQNIIICILTIFLSTASSCYPSLELSLPKLLQLLALNHMALPRHPFSSKLSTHCLMYLYDLTQITSHSTTVLTSSDLVPLLRVLLPFTAYGGKTHTYVVPSLEPHGVPKELLQTLPTELMGERGSLSAGMADTMPQTEEDGKADSMRALGYGERVIMTRAERIAARALSEPQRVRVWLEANFVYHPKSMMTQVVYWNEYRDFTAGPSVRDGEKEIPPPSIAADVIPALTLIFKKCLAVVITTDSAGNPLPAPKYVVKGLMFKRHLTTKGVYRCRWSGCTDGFGPASSEELMQHMIQRHLESPHGTVGPARCKWWKCSSGIATQQHLSLHIPSAELASKLRGGKHGPAAIMHPETDVKNLKSRAITERRPPPLPSIYPVIATKLITPLDERDWPKGESYWASLILRNLARTLRSESMAAELDEVGDAETREEMRRRKEKGGIETGELFGLPIPESIARGQILEGTTGTVKRMSRTERERARSAFENLVEERVLELVQDRAPVAEYLLDCLNL